MQQKDPTTASVSSSAIDDVNRSQWIYNQLSDSLIEGRLKPNDRLKLRELAQDFDTSVTPVRDALQQLVQQGVLVMKSPRDIRVASISRAEYIEIRDIRVELEGMAAAAAAAMATTEDVQRLRSLITLNENALEEHRYLDAVKLNQRFHFEYCRIANMPTLLGILRGLWLKGGPLIAQSYEDGGRDMIEHHYPLIHALEEHDARAAKLAVQSDIISGGRAILQRLSR